MSKEEILQKSVADYLRFQYPDVLFCHIANERKTSPQRGAKLKRLGVRSGMPDVMVFEPKRNKVGLAIELKIKPNKLSENQKQVLELLSKKSWETAVCFSFDETENIIDNYLKL